MNKQLDFDRFEWGKILVQPPWMICPTSRSFLRWLFVGYIVIFSRYEAKFDKTTFSSKSCTPSSSFQKRHGQNDRRKRGNISCCWSKTRFAIVKTNQICIFEGGSPYFPIYCLINSFSHEQLLWQNVHIFSYMQALGSSGVTRNIWS